MASLPESVTSQCYQSHTASSWGRFRHFWHQSGVLFYICTQDAIENSSREVMKHLTTFHRDHVCAVWYFCECQMRKAISNCLRKVIFTHRVYLRRNKRLKLVSSRQSLWENKWGKRQYFVREKQLYWQIEGSKIQPRIVWVTLRS